MMQQQPELKARIADRDLKSCRLADSERFEGLRGVGAFEVMVSVEKNPKLVTLLNLFFCRVDIVSLLEPFHDMGRRRLTSLCRCRKHHDPHSPERKVFEVLLGSKCVIRRHHKDTIIPELPLFPADRDWAAVEKTHLANASEGSTWLGCNSAMIFPTHSGSSFSIGGTASKRPCR